MREKPRSEEILKKVLTGDLKYHEIEQYVDVKQAIEIRQKALEQIAKIKLEHLRRYTLDAESASKHNIENMIGAIQVPVGIAGPLKIQGDHASGNFYIPLATTEGVLVASVNRGCNAITASGGAHAKIFLDSMTRAPVFKTTSISEAAKLVQWINQHLEQLKSEVKKCTHHGELLHINTHVVGRYVYLRMAYDTKDAMGMNMVTIASDSVAKMIGKKTGTKLIALSSNMCTDKKPSAINLIQGRGKSVVAEAEIKQALVKKTLKAAPKDIVEVNNAKLLGSAKAGSFGFNAHFANIIAAIFIATGQDAAQVVDGANGITTAQLLENGNLHISVTIPSLEIGTIGGGTRVETQKECLEILGVAGGGNPPGTNARKFAEIIACAILAGELSLLAAHAAGHLAKAHKNKR